MSTSTLNVTRKSKAQESTKEYKHLYWIDWVRFLAALMVVVCHARGSNWADWGEFDLPDRTNLAETFFISTRAGNEWVVVFFVLSGFLVGGKVLQRVLNQTFDPWTYAIDRVTRIWVPLLPAFLLTAFSAYCCGYPVYLSALVGNLFALQGIVCDAFGHNGPLWTLSYEVWFYALAGFMAVIVMRSSGRFAYLGLAICLAVFTRLNYALLGCWLLGALASLLVSKKKSYSGVLGLFLAAMGAAISQMHAESKSVEMGSILLWLPTRDIAYLIEGLGMGFLIADICRREPSSPGIFKVERLGTTLAAFSYTVYLTHYPLLNLWQQYVPVHFRKVDAFSLSVFVVKILSCLLVGWVLYLPFEARTSAYRKWMMNRLHRRPAAQPA